MYGLFECTCFMVRTAPVMLSEESESISGSSDESVSLSTLWA